MCDKSKDKAQCTCECLDKFEPKQGDEVMATNYGSTTQETKSIYVATHTMSNGKTSHIIEQSNMILCRDEVFPAPDPRTEMIGKIYVSTATGYAYKVRGLSENRVNQVICRPLFGYAIRDAVTVNVVDLVPLSELK